MAWRERVKGQRDRIWRFHMAKDMGKAKEREMRDEDQFFWLAWKDIRWH